MGKSRIVDGSGAGPLFNENPAEEAAVVAAPAAAAVSAPAAAVVAPRRSMGALPVAIVAGAVAVGLWGAWVTKNVLGAADMPPIARVQLSSIVGEYVQAQARSSSTPEQVTAETKAFMGEIEHNLKVRGDHGQVVFVGEAVLSGNVPDITADVRREVYKKVKMPQVAAASNDVMGAMRSAMANPQAVALAGDQGGRAN